MPSLAKNDNTETNAFSVYFVYVEYFCIVWNIYWITTLKLSSDNDLINFSDFDIPYIHNRISWIVSYAKISFSRTRTQTVIFILCMYIKICLFSMCQCEPVCEYVFVYFSTTRFLVRLDHISQSWIPFHTPAYT